MEEKLIRRAANKYRNWMIAESLRHSPKQKKSALGDLDKARRILDQLLLWAERFFQGQDSRVQINPCEVIATEHVGISSPNIYDRIITSTIPQLESDIDTYLKFAMSRLQLAARGSEITPPPLRKLIEEISIINEIWKGVQFKDDQLSVPITDVSLDDGNETVDLGGFIILLNLTKPLYQTSLKLNQ